MTTRTSRVPSVPRPRGGWSRQDVAGRVVRARPTPTWLQLQGTELNPLGWAAVLVPGAIGGAVAGVATRRRAATAAVGAAAGAGAAYGAVWAYDWVRWRRSTIHRIIDLEGGELDDLVDAMGRAGLPIDRFEDRYDLPDGLVVIQRGVTHPARVGRRVDRWLAAAGH